MTEMQKLIDDVRASERSSFYRDLWGTAVEYGTLPYVTREDFLRVPLSKRRYKDERALVKIVHHGRHPFLSEWGFEDIGKESYGLPSKRPLVYMSDPHEALEKSMWCYERGMLPLIGEKDPAIAGFAASKYRVDSLVTDAEALDKFRAHLDGAEPLQSISVIGTSFDLTGLSTFRSYAKIIRLVLALPETGAFADAELSERPIFKALPECIVESDEDHLIVSKTRMLVTPVVRYRTDIPSSLYDGS